LQKALNENTLGVPEGSPLAGRQEDFPYVLVGDDAFPLRHYLLKPYPHRQLTRHQRQYNYRLSRARRCIENAFGIMANRFRIFLGTICLGPKKIDAVVMACCALHNMLRTLAPTKYVQPEDATHTDGTVRNRPQLEPAKVASRRTMNTLGKQYRDYLCDYFNSPEGSINWNKDN
jgi:hypothetical protein